ncbi:MAG: hypothetical protein JNK72_12210 [Myxococcales bacterium]|nr:hypothetical protein [Myxococcales bacterium]
MRGPSLLFVLLLLVTPGLAAQPRDMPTHLEGMVRMRQGDEALAENHVDEAIGLYRQAERLGCPPRVYRALAEAYEQARRFREAAGAWTRAAAFAVTPEAREEHLRRRERLRTMLTAVRVMVGPPLRARAARVTIDHEPPRAYVAGGVEAVLPGGAHRVRVEAPGCEIWETVVSNLFGEEVALRVVLTPIDPAHQR